MTAQPEQQTWEDELDLTDPTFTPQEMAAKAVELGWFGSLKSARQAVAMARGTLEAEKRVVRDGQTWTRTI